MHSKPRRPELTLASWSTDSSAPCLLWRSDIFTTNFHKRRRGEMTFKVIKRDVVVKVSEGLQCLGYHTLTIHNPAYYTTTWQKNTECHTVY